MARGFMRCAARCATAAAGRQGGDARAGRQVLRRLGRAPGPRLVRLCQPGHAPAGPRKPLARGQCAGGRIPASGERGAGRQPDAIGRRRGAPPHRVRRHRSSLTARRSGVVEEQGRAVRAHAGIAVNCGPFAQVEAKSTIQAAGSPGEACTTVSAVQQDCREGFRAPRAPAVAGDSGAREPRLELLASCASARAEPGGDPDAPQAFSLYRRLVLPRVFRSCLVGCAMPLRCWPATACCVGAAGICKPGVENRRANPREDGAGDHDRHGLSQHRRFAPPRTTTGQRTAGS